MGRRPFLLVIVTLVVAACGSNGSTETGPRLVQDVTLAPTTPAATRVLSPTPSPVVIPISTSELISPLEVVTIEADFVLVTPTLPPSKTPTQTPTQTQTQTTTPSPTTTVTATATMPQFPTSIVQPVTAIVSNPLPQVCDSTWFFIQPRPASCPMNVPLTSQGSFQQFQSGLMIWVQNQDAIYVMYDTANAPRWEVFSDTFDEGEPEYDPSIGISPSYTWQPRRGFGELWRGNPAVRQRVGWAVIEWEMPYSVNVQTSNDGTIFVSEPPSRGAGVYALMSGGRDWERYAGGF